MSGKRVRRLLAAGVVLTAVAVGMAVATWGMERDAEAVSVQATRIDSLISLRTELQDSVLAARAGLELSFDDINHALLGLRGVAAAAARARELGTAFTATADALALASEAQGREEAAVEVFKTDLALLRLSTQYFPIAADQVAHSSSSAGALEPQIRALRTELARYDAAPSGELAQQLESTFTTLNTALSTLDPDEDVSAELSVMLGHARVIMDRRQRADDFVRSIMTAPSRRYLEAARSAFASAAPQSLSAALLPRMFASLCAALGLLAFAGAVIGSVRS